MIKAFDLIAEHDEIADMDPAARRLWLRSRVLGADEVDRRSIAALADSIDGYDVLTPFMEDPQVTDVLVNGPDEIWIESSGELKRVDVCFGSIEDLYVLVERLFGTAGSRLDAGCPVGDARLPDGSRIHVVLPPIAPAGPLVSIRRHPTKALSIGALVGSMLSEESAETLRAAVLDQKTIVISGATGAGKTTLLNALLDVAPETERVVVIEETAELFPSCAHWVSLLARPPSADRKGGVTLDELLRAALRMRPDRIVVGEVRGSEAAIALKAMSVGHEGSMVTVHARSARHALNRLVELALEARTGIREDSIRRHVDTAVDLVVHLERRNGIRRVVEVFDARS